MAAGTPLTISHLSLEYVKVQIEAEQNGAAINPSGDVVQMAFPVQGVDPVTGDWKTASWEVAAPPTVTKTEYWARCLVGTGGAVALAAGRYDIWIKVTDSPEVPVQYAGVLIVT
ncbi:MAG TPA: hypothetical protein VIY48_00200 [Candidatus Paceibacterota bacterium]